jgi:hypothetical protein
MNINKLVLLIIAGLMVFEYQFVFIPGRKKLNSISRIISQKKEDSRLLQKLCDEYKSIKKTENRSIIKFTDDNFSVFSFVGETIEKQNLNSNVRGIKPFPVEKEESFETERVKLSMENIALKDLYTFLKTIEGQGTVYVSEFRLSRNKRKPFFLSAEIELITFKNKNA